MRFLDANILLELSELLIIAGFYYLPTVIANHRDANNVGVIFRVNLLFGWTVLGWIAAFIWAILEPPKIKETVKAWSAPPTTACLSPDHKSRKCFFCFAQSAFLNLFIQHVADIVA